MLIKKNKKHILLRPKKIIAHNKNTKNIFRTGLVNNNSIQKLKELNREKKRNAGELTYLDYSGTNDIKKLIKDNGINENMLKVAKCKLESLEEKKRQKNLLLKCSGGVANKPELGEEVCDLMIDTIQAKLSLIKEIDKSLDESVHEERKDENDKLNEYNHIQENTEENN